MKLPRVSGKETVEALLRAGFTILVFEEATTSLSIPKQAVGSQSLITGMSWLQRPYAPY